MNNTDNVTIGHPFVPVVHGNPVDETEPAGPADS
jgi:hypothetical protein